MRHTPRFQRLVVLSSALSFLARKASSIAKKHRAQRLADGRKVSFVIQGIKGRAHLLGKVSSLLINYSCLMCSYGIVLCSQMSSTEYMTILLGKNQSFLTRTEESQKKYFFTTFAIPVTMLRKHGGTPFFRRAVHSILWRTLRQQYFTYQYLSISVLRELG